MEKRARSLACSTVTEVINHTIQVQARGMMQPAPVSLTRDSIREQMRQDCRTIGVDNLDRDIPPVVHVAGTKGKGSTCALVESILRQGKLRTGLYTSPHLVDIRERIRVNGKLLPQSVFDENIMDTYRLLGVDRMETIGFFQFLTLTMFRFFAMRRSEVDVLILETGIGGRLDYTNAIDLPLCCAITRLDFDHVALLGNTLALIAREKSGIAKPNVTLFTISNQPELGVIREYCKGIGAPVQIVEPLRQGEYREIGIKGGDHQLENAALAAAIARVVFERVQVPSKDGSTRASLVEESIANGLALCRFPGRAQMETGLNGKLTYYMDGAHTPWSIECATKWFQSVTKGATGKRALVFHCSSDRSAEQILDIIHVQEIAANARFDHAFFVPPTSGPKSPDGYHAKLAEYWKLKHGNQPCAAEACSPLQLKQRLEALAQGEGELRHVLVVGSFFLVGDALKYWVEDWDVERAFV